MIVFPCSDPKNVSKWKTAFEGLVSATSDLQTRKEILECIELYKNCFGTNISNPTHSQNSLHLLTTTPSSCQKTETNVKDSLLSFFSTPDCVDCVFGGAKCSKYAPLMKQYVCVIISLIDSNVAQNLNPVSVKHFIALVLRNCCGVKDIPSLDTLDAKSLYDDIRMLIDTYFSPGGHSTGYDEEGSDTVSWFDKNRNLIIFLILFGSIVVLFIGVGLYLYYKDPGSRSMVSSARMPTPLESSSRVSSSSVDVDQLLKDL